MSQLQKNDHQLFSASIYAFAHLYIQEYIIETLSDYDFPREHRIRVRTKSALEQIMKEIRRQTRVVVTNFILSLS